MSDRKKEILERGNAAIADGNYEAFLAICTDDTVWTFQGDRILQGKDAVREWMKEMYTMPPKVIVTRFVSEGDFLVAIGEVTMSDKNRKQTHNAYCDVWRFRGDELAELTAFVI